MKIFHLLLAIFLSTTSFAQVTDTLVTSRDSLMDKDTVKLGELYKDTAVSGPHKLLLKEAATQEGSPMLMDDNGNMWKVYTQDGIDVLINVRYLKNYGKYYRLDLYLQNNTDSIVHYNFGDTRISTIDGPVKLFSNDKYYGRVHSRKVWKTVGVTAGTFFVSLLLQWMIQSVDSNNESVLADMALVAVDEATVTYAMLYNYRQRENMREIRHQNIGYLKDYDIPPYNAIEGHAYAKYDQKAKSVNISIPVGSREYILSWDATNLEEVAD